MKVRELIASGTVLHKLSAELLGIIATHADNKALASMRAACRELRDGSAFEFFRRYTSLDIRLSSRENPGFLCLEVVTKTPDVVMAQAMTRSLILPKSSNSLLVSLRNRTLLRDRVPKRVAIYPGEWFNGLYRRPLLDDFWIKQTTLIKPSKTSGITPMLIKRIAALVPQTLQLRILFLEELDVDGDDLINLLQTHQDNLQVVRLWSVVLTKAHECMVALGRLNPEYFEFDNVKDRDDSGNSQDLTSQSLESLELLRRLRQRGFDWVIHESYGPTGLSLFFGSDWEKDW